MHAIEGDQSIHATRHGAHCHSPCSADMRSDVQAIFKQTPVEKQVMMFSATLSQEMRSVCKKFMTNVRVGSLDPGNRGPPSRFPRLAPLLAPPTTRELWRALASCHKVTG